MVDEKTELLVVVAAAGFCKVSESMKEEEAGGEFVVIFFGMVGILVVFEMTF